MLTVRSPGKEVLPPVGPLSTYKKVLGRKRHSIFPEIVSRYLKVLSVSSVVYSLILLKQPYKQSTHINIFLCWDSWTHLDQNYSPWLTTVLWAFRKESFQQTFIELMGIELGTGMQELPGNAKGKEGSGLWIILSTPVFTNILTLPASFIVVVTPPRVIPDLLLNSRCRSE